MDIQQLKQQIPAASMISQFIDLQLSGQNLVGLCPFHPDKDTLSLTIYQETNSWCCFGCGRGGDILNFLTEWGMGFQEAIQWCESRIGKLPKPKFEPKFKKRKSYFPSHHIILYWHNLLRDRREYYKSRLFTDKTIDTFKLGWTGQRYSIPFWGGEPGVSKVIAVQSRRDGKDGPKYLWELKTQPHIFNSYALSYFQRTLVFFSTFDALLAHQDGIRAVAVPGQTVGTGEDCWKVLSSSMVSQIGYRDLVIIPDRGEEKKGYQLAHTLSCSLFEWPDGDYTDYCEFRLKNPAKLFKKLVGG